MILIQKYLSKIFGVLLLLMCFLQFNLLATSVFWQATADQEIAFTIENDSGEPFETEHENEKNDEESKLEQIKWHQVKKIATTDFTSMLSSIFYLNLQASSQAFDQPTPPPEY